MSSPRLLHRRQNLHYEDPAMDDSALPTTPSVLYAGLESSFSSLWLVQIQQQLDQVLLRYMQPQPLVRIDLAVDEEDVAR